MKSAFFYKFLKHYLDKNSLDIYIVKYLLFINTSNRFNDNSFTILVRRKECQRHT